MAFLIAKKGMVSVAAACRLRVAKQLVCRARWRDGVDRFE